MKVETKVFWLLAASFLVGLLFDLIPFVPAQPQKNNDLGYSPENCRFVNQVMQMSNTRLTRHITVDGVTKTMSAWARFYGINVSSLSERIDKLNGKDVAYALYTRKT